MVARKAAWGLEFERVAKNSNPETIPFPKGHG